MKPWPLLALGLLVLLPIACQKGKFAEDSVTDAYDITVVDPNAADATVTVEDGSGKGSVDTGDSGSTSGDGKSGTDTADSGSTSGSGKGSDAGSGTDTADSGSTSTSGKTNGSGKDKSNKGNSGNSGGSEATECAAAANINSGKVHVSGNQKTVTMVPNDAFALKVTGNQNQVHLNMSGGDGARISAICIFATGNQSHVTMDVGVTVGKIFIKARGNKALVEATVSKTGVIEGLQVDANGNQPSIVMKGEGKYPCDVAAVTCEKP